MDKSRLKQYADKVKQESQGLDRRIIARVVGVSFDGRQKVLKQITEETPIVLERDRRNEYDFYAVKVMAEIEGGFQQAGFLPRAMAKLVSKSLDTGNVLVSSVHRIKGGMKTEETGEDLFYGLEISIVPKGMEV